MNVTIVLTHLPLIEVKASSTSIQIPRDTVGIDVMRLGQAKSNALVLRQIAVGVLDRQFRVRLAYVIEHRPAHDAHEGFRPERLAALYLQLDLPCVIGLVAGLAERDQIVRYISARFTTLKMMHVEDRILGSASTVLTDMTVSEKNVLAHVPKPELIALLIARPLDIRILDLLDVEGCGFNHDLGDGKQSADRIDARNVRLDTVLHGRRKPSLVL